MPAAAISGDPYDNILWNDQPGNNPISSDYGAAQAWCSPSDTQFTAAVVDLSTWAGSTVQFRWRLGSDTAAGNEGWYIDDVSVSGCLLAGADVSATKTVSGSFEAGTSVTYTILLSNTGDGAQADNPGDEFTDILPAPLTLVSAVASAGTAVATIGTNTVTWNGALAAGGGNATITIVANIPPGASGIISNQGTIQFDADGDNSNESATVTDDPGTPGADDPTAFSVTQSADLAITKTDGVTTATAGGSTTYTIVASNAGPSDANGATVADTFPAALTCTWTCSGAGGATCTAAGSGNINDTVNLPANGSVTYVADCAISAAASGSLVNTATVSAPAGVTDPVPGNNAASDTDALGAQADLQITKSDGVTTATPGGSVTYLIVAQNAGPSDAIGASVTDVFPPTLTATWTCAGAGGGSCTAAGTGSINDTVNLPSGGSVTYTVVATISASATGTLTNTASVTAPAGLTDPTPGNNSATDSDTLTAGPADLSLVKTLTTAGPFVQGQSLAYTLLVSNAGPAAASDVLVTDTPTNLTITAVSGIGCAALPCTLASLASGASATITVTATIVNAGAFDNAAGVSSPSPDPQPANNGDNSGNGGIAGAATVVPTRPVMVPGPGIAALALLALLFGAAGGVQLRRARAGARQRP